MLFSWLIFIMAFKSLSTVFTRIVLSMTVGKSVISVHAEEILNTSSVSPTNPSIPPPPLTGTFTYGHSSNFEAYLKELGVSYLLRSLALLASPTVTISKSCSSHQSSDEDCTWKIRTDTVFRSHEAEFKLNVESSTTRMDGQSITFIVHKDGDSRLIETQTNVGGPVVSTDIIRDFSDPTRMVVSLRVNNVNASSVFYRSNSTVSST